MLVNTKNMFSKAKLEKKAIGAFNFTNFEQLKAILSASETLNTPVILATSESAIKYMKIENIVSVVKNLTKNSPIEYALHLDHGKSFEICKLCVDSGYTSVMIDASSLNFEENINLSKRIADYAHKFNVSVEAELGKIQGIEDNVESKDSIFTSPLDAKIFVEKTNVDSLAVSIGTSHGAYKFKGESKLDIERLTKINEILNNFPLVLHGASSLSPKLIKTFENSGGSLKNAKGVDFKNLSDAILHGICKINVDTDLRIAFTSGLREALKDPSIINLRDYLSLATDFTKNEVIEHIKLFSNIE